jgi:glycerol-1-phosphate dehydrogenase [NAD(P)+]
MALYGQVVYLPLLYQIEPNAIGRLPEYLEEKNLLFKRVLLVSGETYSFQMAQMILTTVEDWVHVTIASHSMSEVDRLRSLIYQNPVSLLVGVGGGKVLDVVKRVSLLQRVNHLAVPTIISNDGLISPISVLKNGEGRTESIAGQMPMGVVIDLDIVSQAPKKYLQAAAGDILSNLSATFDWELASKHCNEPINDIALHMSVMSAHSAINFSHSSLASSEFLRQVIYGQFNSGIAMAVAGTSRPCSGSEHLISHAIDYLKLSEETLHGLQVGAVSLFSLYLQGNLRTEHIAYARSLQIPLAFATLSPDIRTNLARIFEVAGRMRPGRYTVLDCYSTDELVRKYDDFEAFIERY